MRARHSVDPRHSRPQHHLIFVSVAATLVRALRYATSESLHVVILDRQSRTRRPTSRSTAVDPRRVRHVAAAKNALVRFMYFAPWWLYVLRSGKRFSLRRTLGLLLFSAILAEAIGSGWRYAFGGDRWAPLHALTTSGEILAAVALYLTIEPLLFVLRDCVVGAGIHTAELRRTSIGFTAWCAAVAAGVTWYVTPRVPVLRHVREQLERVTDPHDAIVRFVVGAFIVWLVVLFIARATALAFDGTSFTRANAPTFAPRRPQPPPFVVPPTIGPGAPHAGRLPQPGRIVSARVDPARRDRKS